MAYCHFGSHRKSRQYTYVSFLVNFDAPQMAWGDTDDACYILSFFYAWISWESKSSHIRRATAQKAFPCPPGLDITRHQRHKLPCNTPSSRKVEINPPTRNQTRTRTISHHRKKPHLESKPPYQGYNSPSQIYVVREHHNTSHTVGNKH